MLEIDAGGNFRSRSETETKESKTGTRKARHIVSNQKGSEAKDYLPVPHEIHMKLTNPEKMYIKNHKELSKSVKCCFKSIKVEVSDPNPIPTKKQHEWSASGGSKK